MQRFCNVLIVSLCLLLMAAFPAMGDWQSRTAETVIVKAGETVVDDLWCTGNTVIVDGTVDGDLIVAATNVTINGEVKGSVIGMGYNYSQRGKVQGNLRLVTTNNTAITGSVGKNISVWYLNKFQMGSKSAAQSIRAFGIFDTGIVFDMDGVVKGKVFAKAIDASIGGHVGGDCIIVTQKDAGIIRVKAKAKLHSLQYVASEAPSIAKGAVVGTVKKLPPQTPSAQQRQQAILLAWMWFLGTLVIGFLLIRILPFRAVEWATGTIRWFVATAVGVAVMVGGLVLSILLMFTGIGTPLALLIGSIYLALILVGPLPAYIYIGGALVRLFRVEKRFPIVFLLLVGGVIVFLLSTLPMGIFFTILTTALGIGLLVLRSQKIIIAKPQNGPENTQ